MSAREACYLLQDGAAAECRAVLAWALMHDAPHVHACALEGRAKRAGELLVPVGSVEFVRSRMPLQGIGEPVIPSAYAVLGAHLHRPVWRTSVRDLARAARPESSYFVKPVQTKLFSGFVCAAGALQVSAAASAESYEAEQLACLKRLPVTTELWLAEPVRFLREERYYVLRGDVLSSARYDQEGAEDAPAVDRSVVREMARDYAAAPGAPCAFALDAGVLASGETALVEVNDAWALGYYPEARIEDGYVRMLSERWREIVAAAGGEE